MSTKTAAHTSARRQFFIGWGDWVRLFDESYHGVDYDAATTMYRSNDVSAVGVVANGAAGIAMEDINDRAKVQAYVKANAKKGVLVAEVVIDYAGFGLENFCPATATPEQLEQAAAIVEKHVKFAALLQEFQGTVVVVRVDDLIPEGVTLEGIDEETAFGRVETHFINAGNHGKAHKVRIAWEIEPAGVTRTASQIKRVCTNVCAVVSRKWFGWETDGSHLGNIAIGTNKPVYGEPEPLGTKDDIASAIHRLLDICGEWIIHWHLCGCDGKLHGASGSHGATSNHPPVSKGTVTLDQWKGIFARIYEHLGHLDCLMIDLCFFPGAHDFVAECYSDYVVLLEHVGAEPKVLPKAA